MNLAATLFCAVTTFLSVQAITVSVDRADIRPVSVQPQTAQEQSLYVNGWRPVTTNYDNIGINVSPSSNLAPLHPVLGKLQEHMAVSERLKPQRRNKPQAIEFSPPSILGSFAVFSHATSNLRGENPTDPKTLSTEREYSFLIPPPRDALRFELEPHKKASLRDSEPYVRSSQFIPQAIKPDPRSPTYYIKPASFSTPVHPFSQGRPFVNGYDVQQSLMPPRHPAKQFEGMKPSNEKPYFQPSSNAEANGFNKNNNNKVNAEQNYERYQPQQAPQQQVVNSNYYNQINHPSPYKQSTFERNPSFLVHESHEISYVTPSSTFKFRPATYRFENNQQQGYSTPSTAPPRVESNKFTQPQSPSTARPEEFNKFQSNVKNMEKQRPEPPHHPANSFYITDFQKTRYTPDINEVLPKANPPAKFNQISTTPAPFVQEHVPKVVYVRPEIQQQQYQSSIIPLNINQRPAEVEYETPESISLKHFNEQQFLLQQQLIQQDRQRLREQEKRRQQELQRQQQEELLKRQQEIKLLEQKHKQKQQQQQQQLQQQQQQKQQQQQQLEQLQTVEPDIVKEVPIRHHYSHQYFSVEEPKKEHFPKEQHKYVHYQQQHELPQVSSEPPFKPMKEENVYKQVTVQKFEELVTPPQPTTQEEFQPVIRPYRPQKPFRDQIRRRKPTTLSYDPAPTEAPAVYTVETQEGLTDIPIQTTTAPETTTTPVTERLPIRTRRPGGPLRRRRPSTTTTTTPGPNVSSQEYEEELTKYNTPEIKDFEKKKRIRPIDSNYERRPLNRKRPGQRIKAYNKENADFDGILERVRSTEQPFRDISPTENYPAPFLKELYGSHEYNPTSDKTLTVESPPEPTTEAIPIEFYAETTVPSNLEFYEPSQEDHQEQYTQKSEEIGSLEHVFTKTELNYVETTTMTSPLPIYTTASTTTTTTTTTEPPTTPSTTKTIVSTPKATHRMRPVRYGNATRPRFSIKDYKSRMDYKNRLAQSSSTEPSTVTASTKTRGHKNQQAPADPNFKEPSGRYKYMSRTSYRTTSTTPSNHQVDESNSVSTERTRFTPKKRINTNHYYRSRVTTSPTPNKDQDHTAAHSTARPENVYSSAIRKRPTLKNRLHPAFGDRGHKTVSTESTEMQTLAETGFFVTTTVPSVSSGLTETVNEISENEKVLEETPKNPESETEDEKAPIDLSDVTMDENDDKDKQSPSVVTESEHIGVLRESDIAQNPEEVTEGKSEIENIGTSNSAFFDSTTPFDIRHEEELFAKASQSVADLTSSASALYDKPGMFKAVSPAGENRVISAHLKISTDEPTLPIEAFFQELSKKN